MVSDGRRSTCPARIAYYSEQMGLCPAAVTITGAKKRFGSCSASNRLCFAWRLMRYPEAAVDYVVVHELAHIRYKNHGPRLLPAYRLCAARLQRANQAAETVKCWGTGGGIVRRNQGSGRGKPAAAL